MVRGMTNHTLPGIWPCCCCCSCCCCYQNVSSSIVSTVCTGTVRAAGNLRNRKLLVRASLLVSSRRDKTLPSSPGLPVFAVWFVWRIMMAVFRRV